jgi:hypothetical protein
MGLCHSVTNVEAGDSIGRGPMLSLPMAGSAHGSVIGWIRGLCPIIGEFGLE